MHAHVNALMVLRHLSDLHFTQHALLAGATGLAPTGIDLAITTIGELGVAIEAEPQHGYRLRQRFDLIDVADVAAAMTQDARNAFDVHLTDVTGSTNSDLMRDAEHLPSGRVLTTELQIAGRGRRGRAWTATLGGSLTCSILWKFARGASSLSGLSLAVGLAVARAVERRGAAGVMLKWPNDLVAIRNDTWSKLGGILIEITGAANGPANAVIGIGLNVALGAAATGIDQAVTDLAALDVREPRNRLLGTLLEELLVVLRAFEASGFAPLASEWNARHAFHGRRVIVSREGGPPLDGTAAGVDASGALSLRTANGLEATVSGEVSLRLAPQTGSRDEQSGKMDKARPGSS